ncbi:MAG TPA: DUF6537 domain-containing protein, partial [Thiobacillaceae bacterium]|nr:DUF6537 domain-containing protein [Thiobacillaceae bacterium]
VARLYTEGDFLERVKATFAGDFTLVFHLSPPLFAKPDPVTGIAHKRTYRSRWIMPLFKCLAKLKGLRGTPFDLFGYREERQLERRLISDYEHVMEELLTGLEARNYETAVEIATLPEQIRGYGHIKRRYCEHAKSRKAELLAMFQQGGKPGEKPREASLEGRQRHSSLLEAGSGGT